MGPRNRGQLVVSERAFPVGFNNKTLASTEKPALVRGKPSFEVATDLTTSRIEADLPVDSCVRSASRRCCSRRRIAPAALSALWEVSSSPT